MSTLLSFYIGLHDSNVTAYVDGQIRYAKTERMTGVKHHKADLDFVKSVCKEWGIEHVDAVAFSDGDRNGLGSCSIGQLSKRVDPLPNFFDAPTYCLDHHYCHTLSAWPVVDLEDVDIGVSIDGRGDNGIRRSIISKPASDNPELIYHDFSPSIGSLLELIGKKLSLSKHTSWDVDIAGKIMGAQAYGVVDEDYVESLRGSLTSIGLYYPVLLESYPWREYRSPDNAGDAFYDFDNNQSFRDWLSSVHSVLEEETVQFFKQHAARDSNIVYTGGCAQNVVCNERLMQDFSNLTIPPHSYDGGLSLGAIEFLRKLSGIAPFPRKDFPYWQNDIEVETPSDETIDLAANMIAEGKIVGWFQGRGEVGPRALGNRSILMNPAIADAKDIINQKVKHREYWRPYGASILAEKAHEWFEIEGESPFMLRSVFTNESKKLIVPSIIHRDGTCRIQTVSRANNESYYRLISRFNELTGLPVVLNTSLNGGGQPIFGTREQCIDFLNSTNVDAMVMGDTVKFKHS